MTRQIFIFYLGILWRGSTTGLEPLDWTVEVSDLNYTIIVGKKCYIIAFSIEIMKGQMLAIK